MCKALLKRGYMTGYLRRSLKGFRAEGDIDTIMSVLFYVSVIASGTFMTRPVVPGAPRLIRHYIQSSFPSWKDNHF